MSAGGRVTPLGTAIRDRHTPTTVKALGWFAILGLLTGGFVLDVREAAATEPPPHSSTSLRFPSPVPAPQETEPGGKELTEAEERRRLESLIEEYLRKYGSRKENPPPPSSAPTMDPVLIEKGRIAFEDDCTWCHDASRAESLKKTLPQWRSTVRRMAARRGAEIPKDHWEPIAVYLTSLHRPQAPQTTTPGSPEDGKGSDPEGTEDPSSLSEFLDDTGPQDENAAEAPGWIDGFDFHTTFSPRFLASARDSTVENEGFFPELWAELSWRPEGPFSARIAVCITCHSSSEPEANRIEIAEAVVRFDAGATLGLPEDGLGLALEAGRFLVPFGSPSTQGHPGSAKTVTPSLLYNMGLNVNRDELGPAILPLPYSDEGISLNLDVPFGDSVNGSLDLYAINGLQGFSSVNFFESREYSDNNSEPAVGGRIAVGASSFQLGGSFMAGRFNEEDSAPDDRRLNYRIYGVDLTARFRDLLQFQFDYAKRKNDQLVFLENNLRDDEEVDGMSILGEMRILPENDVYLTTRYDTLTRDSEVPPFGGVITDTEFTVRRFTWGFRVGLPGGSVLMINHEHWDMPDELDNVDVIGLRWVATF